MASLLERSYCLCLKHTQADSRPTFGWSSDVLASLLERSYNPCLNILKRTMIQTKFDRPTFGWSSDVLASLLERSYNPCLNILKRTMIQTKFDRPTFVWKERKYSLKCKIHSIRHTFNISSSHTHACARYRNYLFYLSTNYYYYILFLFHLLFRVIFGYRLVIFWLSLRCHLVIF